MTSFALKVRSPTGIVDIKECTLASPLDVLLSLLEQKAKISKSNQQLLIGYPPKAINTSNLNATLESLGIKNGDQIILKQAGTQQGIVKGTDTGPYIPPSSSKGHFIRRKMKGDNSCLFHSIAYVCENKSTTKGFELRKLVGNIIAENPKVFTEAFLGTPTYEYVSLINHPDYWGGAVEIAIFSEYFKVEIISFDTQTMREDRYGQDKNYTRRALIIYTGSHYDALALAEHGGASEQNDQVLFNVTDTNVLTKARAFIKEEHQKWLSSQYKK